MDPNATLMEIESALIEGDKETAAERCDDLNDWLNRGGFEPSWNKHPQATTYYRKRAKIAYRK
jgi:hypothetical protein